MYEYISDLFEIEKPLNDDTGHTVAKVIVQYILKAAGMDNMHIMQELITSWKCPVAIHLCLLDIHIFWCSKNMQDLNGELAGM